MGDCLNDANHSNGIVLGGYIYDTHHYKVLNSVPFRCLDLCKRTPPPLSVSSSILDYSNLNRRSQRDFGILSEIPVLVRNQNLGLIALPTATIYYLLLPVKEIDDQREIVNQNTKIDEIWGKTLPE